MHRRECNTHNLRKSNKDFSYPIFPVKKNKCWKNFKIMRKLLFNYSFYSHPEIGNFRVWQFLKAWLCCSHLFFVVIFGALSWWISWCVFGTFLLRFSGGCMCEPFVVLLPLIPLPNPWVKRLDFGVFSVPGLEEFLARFLQLLLIWQVLVNINLAMDSPWGVPSIPKVVRKSVERFGISGVGFWGVDPRVLFILSSLGHTSLTGADPGRVLLEWTFGWVRCCPVLLQFWVWVVLELDRLYGVLGLSSLDQSDKCASPAWPV
jgi:hypothetical protein